jgi:hypothetical protein
MVASGKIKITVNHRLALKTAAGVHRAAGSACNDGIDILTI